MNEAEVLEYLTDSDGSTRDITFTPTTLACVGKFIELFLEEFSDGELLDQDGEVVEMSSESVVSYITQREEGCIHGQLKSRDSFVSQVHLFLDWSEGEKIAVEISYFPNDLCSDFTTSIFFEALNSWWGALQANEVFVRYENASWEFYDPEGLGVFYHAVKA
ncbi:hypothetical protein [Microbulbifer sp. VAAF005]|uniref:hypothetical protein n=1 Tax=Microbulbifer sp. VAAF005 TaxID=3034230 RepID=UPI0024ACB93A|nr:hypothetical protein [Microbulbifer sp. VAAF005]WHI45951.1 hypothetical protein P0078_19865 [Microbulbifer sp. VAAF005]